jgi:hypothetical protein
MNDKVQRALENDELFQYMVGEGDYYFYPEMADLPTDPVVAFHFLVEAYKDNPDLLERTGATIGVMSSNATFSWFSLYYLLGLLTFLRARGINSDATDLIGLVETNVAKYKSSLMNNYAYEGSQWSDGLWGDVVRLATIIEKDFDVSMKKITQG